MKHFQFSIKLRKKQKQNHNSMFKKKNNKDTNVCKCNTPAIKRQPENRDWISGCFFRFATALQAACPSSLKDKFCCRSRTAAKKQ
jgi:hypothetical protein